MNIIHTYSFIKIIFGFKIWYQQQSLLNFDLHHQYAKENGFIEKSSDTKIFLFRNLKKIFS
jgi:hypothetical protein